MTVLFPHQVDSVARKKPDPEPAPEARDRIDLRAEPAWVARVIRQAERLGISVSAYIRAAVSRQLEKDEATEPRKGCD